MNKPITNAVIPAFKNYLTKSKKVFLSFLVLFLTQKAIAQPVANFSSSITSGCAPILVDFRDQSSGNPTQWKWDLGNGTISNLQDPSTTYFNPGRYTVKLLVKGTNQQDSIVKVNYITVYESPFANFSSNATIGCTPFLVSFSDKSTTNAGSINSWQWDFGDGLLSNEQHPLHTYSLTGNYNITLKVGNTNGCIATLKKSSFIKNSSVKAGFSNKINASCSPNEITFKNESLSSEVISMLWDFGDSTTSTLLNPVHTYKSGGTYTVKLIAKTPLGCIDSFTKTLQVLTPVTASFTADKVISCKAPVSINFTSVAQSNTNFYWDFGDSTISTSPNPVHKYVTPGNYTVKLVAKNGGCIDSLEKTNYLLINSPIATLKNAVDSGCLPFTKKFLVATNKANPVTSYSWNFGDGGISADSTPIHIFNKTGYYNVSLIAVAKNGCIDTSSIFNAIKVSTSPKANFSEDLHNICAKTPVSFTNLSSGNITGVEWNFGDLLESYEKDAKHTYKDTGWKSVQLVVSNGGCTDTLIKRKLIYVKPAVAKFTATMDCSNPFVRSFINISRGATTYLWNFGDGTTSTEFSPVHTYKQEGDYDIQLSVWNDSTGCDHSLSKLAKVVDFKPSFVASQTIICRDDIVDFTSIGDSTEVGRFYWNFGDGTKIISTDKGKVSHKYVTPGIYSVTLVTSSVLNCKDSLTRLMYITVNAPKAKFGVFNSAVQMNVPVSFLDSSSSSVPNALQKWIWKYGDGVIDSLTRPPFQHSFNNYGSYAVSLKLIDNQGCTDSFKLSPPLKVVKINAAFRVLNPISCKGSPVKFSCAYATTGIFYRWDFGDGTISTVQNPTHIYTNEGSYNIKLRITTADNKGDSTIQINGVTIKETVAHFAMSDSFKTCPPLLVQFTDQSTNAVDAYWDFGDSTYTNTANPSHFYTYPGVYTATLYAKGPSGCVATMQKQIVVQGPRGTISSDQLKFCKPYNVNFQIHSVDAVSYIWDFNDGNIMPSFDSTINYTYKDSGIFLPKILLIDNAGCRVPVTSRDTIFNIYTVSSFNFHDSIICTQSNVSFKNTSISNDAIVKYLWDFGDGTTSTEKNPIHQYTLPGKYYPTLTSTTSAGCFDQYRSALAIKVLASPDMNILSTDNGCIPLKATLSVGQSETASSYTLWHWDFGNGNVSNEQYPPEQLYNTPGTYTVTLTGVNAGSSCSKTIQHIIEAYSSPVVNVSNDTLICKGQKVSLQASGATSYQWEIDSKSIADTGKTIIVSPATSTKYTVTASSSTGCSNTKTVTVNVKQPVALSYKQSEDICIGQSKQLNAYGANSYEWFPATGLSCTNQASPVAKPDSSITYRVIGWDDMGCSKDTGYIKLTVYSPPFVSVGENKTTNAGQTVTLNPTISADVTQVIWTPQTDVVSGPGSLPGLTIKAKKTTQYNIEVKNRGGCSASDNVTVFVTCDGSNVFMPTLFSPNHDGSNDVFYPRGTGLYKIKSLRIFSRWGETVFENQNFNANDPTAGWNGSFKGSGLNSSEVFVYTMQVICDNNEVLDLNGTVMLKK